MLLFLLLRLLDMQSLARWVAIGAVIEGQTIAAVAVARPL